MSLMTAGGECESDPVEMGRDHQGLHLSGPVSPFEPRGSRGPETPPKKR